METKQEIIKMREEGKVILSSHVFKNQVTYEPGNGDYPFLVYKGKKYRNHIFHLTYGNEKFEELIP
jgi:hypothetical protein